MGEMLSTAALWREAWRGLPENPLARYLLIARQRAYLRLPFWRRHWLMLVTVELVAFYAIYISFIFEPLMSSGTSARSKLEALDFVLGTISSLTVMVYSVWLCQGVYSAVLDSLRALGQSPRRLTALGLDDSGVLTQLSDREIVLSFVRVILPPLLRRVVIGAAVTVVSLVGIAASYELVIAFNFGPMNAQKIVAVLMGSTGQWADSVARTSVLLPNLWQALLLSPLTFICCLISGVLAALAGSMLMLAVGRGSTETGASGAAALSVVAIMAHLWSSSIWPSRMYSAFHYAVVQFPGRPGQGILLLVNVIAVVLLVAMVTGACAWAARSRAAHQAMPVAILLSAILAGIAANQAPYLLLSLAPDSVHSFDVRHYEILLRVEAAIPWTLSSLAPYNPMAAPSLLCWGIDANIEYLTNIAEWLRWPLLVVLQLSLVAVFAHFARDAVARRRQAA